MLAITLSKVLGMSRTILMRVHRLNGFLVSKETVVLRRFNRHRERFRKLTFRVLALRQSEYRNCGVFKVYMGVNK